jgi:hypothetical protein
MMLNNRKRFVFLAALAAVLVLLAGGANALAVPAVRCVPNVTVNPGCTASTTYPTIQAAVTAANPGDPIFVGPGKYNESVTISKGGLSLFGAQVGNDARTGRYDRTKESIVDATGKGGPAFIVNANRVVIDGFTLTGDKAGDPPAGILVASQTTGYYWAQILNNILEKNGTGVFLYAHNLPSPPVTPPSAVVEHNLFRNNNAGTGENVGFGILTDEVTFPVITENEFSGNKSAAIVIVETVNATVTNNTSDNDGAFAFFGRTNQCVFSHNKGRNFGRKGVLPVEGDSTPIYPDAAVDIGAGNNNLLISDNFLAEGDAPISNGIAFTPVFNEAVGSSAASFNVNVRNNSIRGFPENGIVAEEQTGGTLQGSWIVGNEVRDNGMDGIFIDVNNQLISLFDNEAEGNNVFDCHDTSIGIGTLGTANWWLHNTGNLSYPRGLCTPGRRHDRDWDWR